MIPLRTEPLRQFLEICGSHPEDKFLPMGVVNCKDVVCVEYDVAALLQAVQPSFDKRIVHDTTEVAP